MKPGRHTKLSMDRQEVSAILDEIEDLLRELGRLPVLADPKLARLFSEFLAESEALDATGDSEATPRPVNDFINTIESLANISSISRKLGPLPFLAANWALHARRMLGDRAGFAAILALSQANYLHGFCVGIETDTDDLNAKARRNLEQHLKLLVEPRRARRLAEIEEIETLGARVSHAVAVTLDPTTQPLRKRITTLAREDDAAGNLGHGWKTRIAKRVGLSAQYVGRVFKEDVENALVKLAQDRKSSGWPQSRIAQSVANKTGWSAQVVARALRKKNEPMAS